jgi:nickel superoxide dismutase
MGENVMFLTRLLKPTVTASAHCDLPCGVYDPEQARIEAESCYKIIEKYNASSDELFKTRAIVIKEERAELAKHHIDVLWSDYFKPEHVQKYPEITELCWKAAKQCSKVKGSLDLGDAKALLDMIDKIADVWTKAGGPQATRVAKAAAARA